MSQGEPPPDWDELRREMRALAARITRIEERLEIPPLEAAPSADQQLAVHPGEVVLSASAAAVPALGRALLGMAGAYLLRAVTESRALPQPAGVLLGIVYAMAWLVWAARVGEGRRTEAAFYSLNSALMLGPLLWEATLRFHAL